MFSRVIRIPLLPFDWCSSIGYDIAVIHKTIAAHLAKHHYFTIILRDVKGIFDKVWHEGLIYKLGRLNITNNLYRALRSFPHHRTVNIQRKKAKTQSFILRVGVPQETMLSPTLYNAYLSNLPPTPQPHTKDIRCTDDITQIITSSRGPRYHNDRVIE